MEILLDTHMVLWWLADDARLSAKARALIADPSNRILTSAASAWEIAIKQAFGKLHIDGDLEQAAKDQGFELLPITFAHTAELRHLPPIHRDLFDRILVAQARVEHVHLLTTDSRILQYPAQVVSDR